MRKRSNNPIISLATAIYSKDKWPQLFKRYSPVRTTIIFFIVKKFLPLSDDILIIGNTIFCVPAVPQ